MSLDCNIGNVHITLASKELVWKMKLEEKKSCNPEVEEIISYFVIHRNLDLFSLGEVYPRRTGNPPRILLRSCSEKSNESSLSRKPEHKFHLVLTFCPTQCS